MHHTAINHLSRGRDLPARQQLLAIPGLRDAHLPRPRIDPDRPLLLVDPPPHHLTTSANHERKEDLVDDLLRAGTSGALLTVEPFLPSQALDREAICGLAWLSPCSPAKAGQSGRPRGGRANRQARVRLGARFGVSRSEEHTSELQSPCNLVCRLLLEKN